MGNLFTMFQAEVMAIVRSTQLLLSKNIKRRIYIYSDSREPIATLAKTAMEWALGEYLSTG